MTKKITTIPSARIVDEAKETKLKIRRSRLRAIDDGTVYDAATKLIKLARDIRDGKEGQVTDCIVIVRIANLEGGEEVISRVFGNGGWDRWTRMFMDAARDMRMGALDLDVHGRREG
jgi:hypothetical protein